MVLNDRQKRAFKTGCIAEIKRLADGCNKVADPSELFPICQLIQSFAIKIFESSKGSVNDEYWKELFPENSHADSSAPE